MAGYSGKPLTQKLGIQPGFCIFVEGAPATYGRIVGKLPAKVNIAAAFVIAARGCRGMMALN